MKESKEIIKLSDEQYLQVIKQVALLFHDAISIENTIVVTDKEKFISHLMGNEEKISSLVGKPFPRTGNIPTVINTGSKQSGIIPKEVYGIEFKSTSIPINNNKNEVIGTISVALSLKNQNKLQEVTENISSSVEELSATTEDISSSSMNLAENVSDILVQTQDVIKLLEQTSSILDFVNNVASNSRLLGLNAAIEAARAGEVGHGFSVVASEIRKMAENSTKSVNETKKLLSDINEKINHLLKKTQELSDISQSQSAATQEIAASIQDLALNTQVVQEVSEII